jgi:putative transposase
MLTTKSIKYRIYPSRSQIHLLNSTLEGCRLYYNHLLLQRKDAWEKDKKYFTCFEQQKLNKNFLDKTKYDIYAQVIQNVAVRIDLAFKAFFRRLKNGEKPGYPRFKSYGRYDSFTYPQRGWKIEEKNILIPKIGKIKSIIHKNIEGVVKTCTVKKEADKWFIIFVYETDYSETIPETDEAVGIDVGLSNFAVFSDETVIDNPRFFKEEEKKIAKLQSRRDKTKNKKLNKVIQKRHNKVKNKRKDFCHKLSRKIVNKYSKIFVEDLSINVMKEDMKYLSKSINDASWNLFIKNLVYKAEDAGRLIKLVNPAYTSQDCSNCSYRVKKKLSERIHNCPNCELVIDRDLNAAKNILRIGLYSLGENP